MLSVCQALVTGSPAARWGGRGGRRGARLPAPSTHPSACEASAPLCLWSPGGCSWRPSGRRLPSEGPVPEAGAGGTGQRDCSGRSRKLPAGCTWDPTVAPPRSLLSPSTGWTTRLPPWAARAQLPPAGPFTAHSRPAAAAGTPGSPAVCLGSPCPELPWLLCRCVPLGPGRGRGLRTEAVANRKLQGVWIKKIYRKLSGNAG